MLTIAKLGIKSINKEKKMSPVLPEDITWSLEKKVITSDEATIVIKLNGHINV